MRDNPYIFFLKVFFGLMALVWALGVVVTGDFTPSQWSDEAKVVFIVLSAACVFCSIAIVILKDWE